MNTIEIGKKYTFYPYDYNEVKNKIVNQKKPIKEWVNNGIICNIEIGEMDSNIYYDVRFFSHDLKSSVVIMFGENVIVKALDQKYVECYNEAEESPICCIPIKWFEKNFQKMVN